MIAALGPCDARPAIVTRRIERLLARRGLAGLGTACTWITTVRCGSRSVMIWTVLDFVFDTLRQDPRYDDLIRAVGLPHTH